jgi:hypothetical protein
VSPVLVERPSTPAAAPLGAGSLAALVRAALAAPEAVGCLVCGGALRAVSGGVRCAECGSELSRGVEPRRVARTVQR